MLTSHGTQSSWEPEGSFPDSCFFFVRVFTSAAALLLSTNHFQHPPPTTTTAATTSCALQLFSSSSPSPIALPPPCSLRSLPSLFLNFSAAPLADLTTFRLLLLASSSFQSLASILLNQLNCCPPLHLCGCSFISCLHHVSESCSAVISLCLNQLYTALICV